jgi:hypothetical protein
LHCTMWLFALVWLFFGDDGKGVFNKLGCSVNWAEVGATFERQLGFGSSRADIEAATADCKEHNYRGFWVLAHHFGTFGMLVFTGPIALSALRTTTASVRLEIINELQSMGFGEEDILTHMHEHKGSIQHTIADLLAPKLRILLNEARQAPCNIDQERSEKQRLDVATAPHTSGCACRVCSILRTAARDISPLHRLELGQKCVADPATLSLDGEAKGGLSLQIKTALRSAINEHCEQTLSPQSRVSNGSRSEEVDLTNDGALQVLFERLFATGDDDGLVMKAKDSYRFRVKIGVAITALLTLYRVYTGISHFLNKSGEDHSAEPYLILVHNLALALCDCTLGYWWVLLQLAVEMATVQIKRVTEQIKGFGAHGTSEKSEKWEEVWVESIETPALRLVRRILPALNDGFGASLICIVAALTLHVVSHVHDLVVADQAFWDQPERRWEMCGEVVLVIFLTVLPGFLTWSAARISSECDDLMHSLIKRCHRSERKFKYYNGSWRNEQALIEPLQKALAMANDNHGAGFMIPKLHAKLSFRSLLSFMTALVVFLIEGVPHLVGEAEGNPYQFRLDIRCPFNWHTVQGKCLRLFGEDSSELCTWSEAEEVCQQYGGHLMSIATHQQQLAAAAIVTASQIPKTQAVWIGLTRHHQSGTMQWIDNTSMKFKHWAPDEPDLPADGDHKCVDDSLPAHQGFTVNATRDDCGMVSESSGFKWWDTPCSKTSFKPSVATSTAVDECYHAYYPFICSKPALPGE